MEDENTSTKTTQEKIFFDLGINTKLCARESESEIDQVGFREGHCCNMG